MPYITIDASTSTTSIRWTLARNLHGSGQETLTMPNKKYIVDSIKSQRTVLLVLATKGNVRARKMKRAAL